MIAILILLALFIILAAVLCLRTVRFTPKPVSYPAREDVEFDRDAAVFSLQQLIRCKTISYADPSVEDDAEFEKLIGLLPELYPNVFAACTLTRLPGRALLFRWPGKAQDAPSVLMAHYDVVPADEESWARPAFEGVIEDGVLWGRGTIDTKVTFNGILFAANSLISQGFVPAQDVYFAFSGGEEVSGPGAVNIVNWFVGHNIQPALVVDEGGAVVENVFPGLSIPCGLIGIAEKGHMNVKFSVESAGGHASSPPPHTPVGVLAKACCDVENHPFQMHLSGPAGEMFDTLGRHTSTLYRVIFANIKLFAPVLDLLCRKTGGEINALLRTTVAFTQASGSPAANVIPPAASLTANLRLNPLDSSNAAVNYLQKTVDNANIKLTVLHAMEPSPVSETNCEAWNKVAAAVANTWPGCVVAPYLMVQCSDSRHYRDLSNHVYRFSAMDLTSEERATIHGNNERIRLETIGRSVEFFIRLMKQC